MKRHHLSKSINKPSFKGISRAREIVTLVKHLCGKHENLSSIHRTHIKEEKKKAKPKTKTQPGVVLYTHFNTGKTNMVGPWSSLASQPSLLGEFQTYEIPVSKYRWIVSEGQQLRLTLVSTHKHTGTQVHLHKNAHLCT